MQVEEMVLLETMMKPNPNDIDVVIEKPNRNFIGRLFDKIEVVRLE